MASRKKMPTDDAIVAEYQKTFSAYKAADTLGINWKSVYVALARSGVAANGLRKQYDRMRLYNAEQEQEIGRLYSEGMIARKIAERFGGSVTTVLEAVKRQGVVRRTGHGHVADVPEAEASEICAKYMDGVGATILAALYNRGYETIIAVLRRNGITARRKTNLKRGHYRHRRDGYVSVKLDISDPFYSMTGVRGFVLEHRIVMARKLNRALRRSETVHHVDGNHSNNAPENLQLRQGKHGKHVVMCCLDCGSRNVGHTTI